MYAERHGSGRRVFVGLHGWGGSCRTFDPLLPFLPSEATLWGVDLPGYGRSPLPARWGWDDVIDPRRIIAMMLQFPEIIPEIVQARILEFFSHSVLKSAGEAILYHRFQSPDQLPELLATLEEGPLKKMVVSLAMGDESWTRKGCKALLSRFRESRQRQASGLSMQVAIEAAEREHNEAEVTRLLSEKQKMAVRREKQKMSALRDK